MEHGVRVYSGVSRSAWDTLLSKLQANQKETAKKLETVHAMRDFDVELEKEDPNFPKHYQGDFQKPVNGIRAFTQLSPDLVVCTPHLDITKSLQLSSGGKLQQRFSTYPERAARAVNPSRYDRPFFLHWAPAKGSGSLVVLTPGGFSDATQHVLETEILPRTGGSPSLTNRSVPGDPLKVVQAVQDAKRLGKIDSATVAVLDKDGNVLQTTSRVFRDGGSFPEFKRWVQGQAASGDSVALQSVVLSVKLNDPLGKSFDMVIRPGDEDTPLGVQVSQKSELRTDAYQVVMGVLRQVLS